MCRGKETSTNPIASIYAWSRGLAHRAKLDQNEALKQFSDTLEEACLVTVDKQGKMTKDLAIAVAGTTKYDNFVVFINNSVSRDKYLNTDEFMTAIADNLQSLWTPKHDALVAANKI